MERLQYLSLKTLYDVAFLCGKSSPVSMYICGDTGLGKSLYAEGISNAEKIRVKYITGQMSPMEHRKTLAAKAENHCLIIHDDIGRLKARFIEEYFNNFMDVIDGHIRYTQYNMVLDQELSSSLVITSTLDQYNIFANKMRPSGLLDRLLVIPLTLSDEMKMEYREKLKANKNKKTMPKNPVENRDEHEPNYDMINDLEPRLYSNVLSMSRFLTDMELRELIDIVNHEQPIYSY